MLLGKSRLVEVLQKTARASPADQTLLAAQRSSQTTFRFSDGRIHQNLHEEDLIVWVKVACRSSSKPGSPYRVGVATTSSLRHEALLKAVGSALAIARLAAGERGAMKHASPPFQTTAPREEVPTLRTFFPETVQRPLSDTVRRIRSLWERTEKAGMRLAGSITLGESELAVAGSGGLAQYQPFTVGGLRLVAARNGASGFSAQAFRDISELDPENLLERAWNFCRMNRAPCSIPLGRYDVLLEPEAVAEILEWMALIGFGAKQVAERTSFMAGRIGERILDRKLTLADDGADPRGLAVPFDLEGVPKQKVILIDRGKAAGVVYDSHYAGLSHRKSTGHALPYDEIEGPLATNLLVEPGSTAREDLLKILDRGLWISRFHYVSGLLNTQEALMTGLTRDGTFLVRDGKTAGAVKNLRFTQPMLEAFSRVAAASRQLQRVADPAQGFSSVVAPAVVLRGFTFTGQTR